MGRKESETCLRYKCLIKTPFSFYLVNNIVIFLLLIAITFSFTSNLSGEILSYPELNYRPTITLASHSTRTVFTLSLANCFLQRLNSLSAYKLLTFYFSLHAFRSFTSSLVHIQPRSPSCCMHFQ